MKRNIPPGAPAGPAADVARIRGLLVAFSRRRSLRDPIAASCEDLDLTPVQVHILLWLGSDGALTMGELARRVSVTEKTITGVVDRLERDGLVERVRDPADRRVVHVRLSDAGAQAHRRVDAEINARLEGALALLDPPDRRNLIRIFEKLLVQLSLSGETPDAAPSTLPGARPARASGARKTSHPKRENP